MNYLLNLPLLILLPIIASIIIFSGIFKDNYIYTRRFSTAFSIIYFFYSLLFYVSYKGIIPTEESILQGFNPEFISSFSILENSFLSNLGINFSFGVDSLSVIMIILTTLAFGIVIYSSKLFIHKDQKMFYGLVFILQSILIGIFSSLDMFVFFALWELELIPMYLLISLWGNKYAKKSALKFVLYTFGGSLFILLGILLLYFINHSFYGVYSADITQLNFSNMSSLLQIIISICFVIGFGVKIPIIPLHRWLADTHTNSCTPVSMILASVLLKLGVYGLIRFNLELLPLGFAIICPIIGIFAVVNIIYGGAIAYFQKDIKRIVAYSSISQMGIILLGLYSMTKIGYLGSVFHCVSHGVVALGLFFIVGIIKQKFNTNNITRLSGLACVNPRLFGLATLISFGAIGVPLTSGFIGEFLSIYGSLNSASIIYKLHAIIGVSVLLISALYILKIIHEVFYGGIKQNLDSMQDIASHEFLTLCTISFIIILLGCFPSIIINFICP